MFPRIVLSGRHAASAVHLSYKICTLLLFGHNCKRLTQRVFGLCCMSLNLNSGGSDREHDLPRKLQQRLTRWAPLYNCETAMTAIDMVLHIESFGSGSLLELAALHGICLAETAAEKDALCDICILSVTSFSGDVRSPMPCCATRYFGHL